MIRRVLLAAILAGLAAGFVMGVIQHVRLTPLIIHAEQFETAGGHDHGAAAPEMSAQGTQGAEAASVTGHSHGTTEQSTAGEHVHDANAWAPQDGWERTFYTTVTAMVTAAGFALLMTGMSFLAGIPIKRENGLVWGLCGFIAVSLAPAIGLPPELPGMPAAGVVARQGWWLGTILCTGLAIWLVVASKWQWRLAGAALLTLAPHVIGAPRPPHEDSAVPATLAAEFVTSSLGANLVMWLLIGVFLAIALKPHEEATRT